MLLDTGNKELVEHTDVDPFWGDGGDGSRPERIGKGTDGCAGDFEKRTWKNRTPLN